MYSPKQQEIESKATSPVKMRRLSLTRGFGKLPRLSKQLMYDSVKNQPLPPTSFALSNPSPSSPNVVPTNKPLYFSRQTPAPPLRRLSSSHLPEHSVNYDRQRRVEPHSAGGKGPGQFPWREIFGIPRKASRSPLREPAEESPSKPDRMTALVAFGTRRRNFRSSSLSSYTSNGSQELSQDRLHNGGPRRRSSAYENLSHPSIMSRFRNKRDSVATLSTQGDEPPPTPNGVAESHEAHDSSALPDYGLPADPFRNSPARIQQFSPLQVTNGSLDIPQDFRGFGELGRFELSDGEEWNISTPRRTVDYEEVPQWVYASRSASPVGNAKLTSTDSTPFISCMGLQFPTPPPINEADAPRLGPNDAIVSGPFETFSHHRRSVSHGVPRTSTPYVRRNAVSHRSSHIISTEHVAMVSSDSDEHAWPLEQYGTTNARERRRHRRPNRMQNLSPPSSRPSASTDFGSRIPAYRHSDNISPLEFAFKRFSPPEISIFDPIDDA